MQIQPNKLLFYILLWSCIQPRSMSRTRWI